MGVKEYIKNSQLFDHVREYYLDGNGHMGQTISVRYYYYFEGSLIDDAWINATYGQAFDPTVGVPPTINTGTYEYNTPVFRYTEQSKVIDPLLVAPEAIIIDYQYRVYVADVTINFQVSDSTYGQWGSSSKTAKAGDYLSISGTTVTCKIGGSSGSTRWTNTVSTKDVTGYTSSVSITSSSQTVGTSTITINANASGTAKTYTVTKQTITRATVTVNDSGTFNSNLSINVAFSGTGDSSGYTLEAGIYSNSACTSLIQSLSAGSNTYKMTGSYYSKVYIKAVYTPKTVYYSANAPTLSGCTSWDGTIFAGSANYGVARTIEFAIDAAHTTPVTFKLGYESGSGGQMTTAQTFTLNATDLSYNTEESTYSATITYTGTYYSTLYATELTATAKTLSTPTVANNSTYGSVRITNSNPVAVTCYYGTSASSMTSTKSVSANSYADVNVTPGTQYYYKFKTSGWYDSGYVTHTYQKATLTAPTLTQVRSGSSGTLTSIRITNSNAAAVTCYYGTSTSSMTSTKSISANSSAAVFLTPLTTYYFKFSATNYYTSSNASVTTKKVLLPPSLSTVGSGAINVSNTNAIQVSYYRGTSQNNLTYIGTLSANNNTTNYSLGYGNTYYYQFMTNNTSYWDSDIVSETTSYPPVQTYYTVSMNIQVINSDRGTTDTEYGYRSIPTSSQPQALPSEFLANQEYYKYGSNIEGEGSSIYGMNYVTEGDLVTLEPSMDGDTIYGKIWMSGKPQSD